MSDRHVTPRRPDQVAAERGQDEAPPETPDLCGAYPRLDDAQIAALAALGQRRAVQPGEILFREGDRNCDFFVILGGKVEVVEGHGTAGEHMLGVHGRGRFLGELGLLTGETAFYSAIAAGPGEVLTVPAERLRALVTHDPALGDLILRACLIRRSILIGLGVGLRIVGSRYSPDSRRLRDFAARNRLPCRWLDLEQDPGAEALLGELGVAPEDTPIVILYGRRLLRNPSNAELAAAIGLPAPGQRGTACDLLVVGAGPAGLSAAVYGSSEGLDTVVLDGTAAGGQAGTSSRIENYLGFPSGISGAELAARAVIQARKFGARFVVPAEAVSLRHGDGHYQVRLGDDTSVSARCVIIATGVRYRRLDVPRLEHFEKTSVYYAASQAEALLCRGDPVVIVGGGNSAGQATVFLARHVARLTLVVREKKLAESMSRYLIDQIEQLANVDVLLGTEVRELLGAQALEAVVVGEGQAGPKHIIEARALFVFIGATPCTSWVEALVDLDDHGYIRTGIAAEPAPGGGSEPENAGRRAMLETSQPGILAAGDVCSGSVKRVAAAVGDGAMAVRLALEHVHFG